MIHVLMDDGEFIGLIANIDTATVLNAVRVVDVAFREVIDVVPVEELGRAICESIGLPYDQSMVDWRDVLLSHLVKLGGTLVDYFQVECTPPRNSAGRTCT